MVHRAHGHPDADALRAGAGAAYDLRSLRFIASVGEPLNPEAVVWGERTLGPPMTTGGRPRPARS